MTRLLELLHLTPSDESRDYVANKGQFHLFSLLTEQRHQQTWDLGSVAREDTERGLRAILAVDDDLEERLARLAASPAPVEQMADAIVGALAAGRRVYVYGCGATGRLAKQLESAVWRPFWRRLQRCSWWSEVASRLPARIGDAVTGEMTGADRALVSSLEGFEDLPQIGALQLEDHGVQRGDVVICVTEGGETSSVIGTILSARAQHGDDVDGARRHLFFVYNNPDEVLRPFDRSRRVLDEPGITRLCLATGPQAIAGSTRMQATTIETFVVGVALEEAAFRLLRPVLSDERLAEVGFDGDRGVQSRLRDFTAVRAAVDGALPALAQLTRREAATYTADRHATYFAKSALIAVFIDCAERSPTFRLFPLDKSAQGGEDVERRSWVQVWTGAPDRDAAWLAFLGRPFRGLGRARYEAPFRAVEDPYLRRAALASLDNAGDEQAASYDFSFGAENLTRRGPTAGDLGVLVLVDGERTELADRGSRASQFAAAFGAAGARVAVVRAGDRAGMQQPVPPGAIGVDVAFDEDDDPLQLRRQLALKILLNAHSTATMARLGRVVGNTMTNVSPSNLKLIGRATFLVQSHVDDVLKRERWTAKHGATEPITFAEANAVLYDAMRWVRDANIGQTAEVALSIVRILASLEAGADVGWDGARAILEEEGLAEFLRRHNPALDSAG